MTVWLRKRLVSPRLMTRGQQGFGNLEDCLKRTEMLTSFPGKGKTCSSRRYRIKQFMRCAEAESPRRTMFSGGILQVFTKW